MVMGRWDAEQKHNSEQNGQVKGFHIGIIFVVAQENGEESS